MKNNYVKNKFTKETISKPTPIDEEVLYDGGAMITETDTLGVITFANRKFVEMTGYTKKELIGSPHNINRHPDMPTAAFKMMWGTVQEGELWQGIVKNLCKSGKYYWVDVWIQAKHDAEGNHIGYIAGRKVPHLEDIKHARTLYKQLKVEEHENSTIEEPIFESISADEFLDSIQKEKKRIYLCVNYVKQLTQVVDTPINKEIFGEEALFCESISKNVNKLETIKISGPLLEEIEHLYKMIYSLYAHIDQVYNVDEEVVNSQKITAKTKYNNLVACAKELLENLDTLEKECLEGMFT